MASSIPLAATGGLKKMSIIGRWQSHEHPHGTNMAEAVAPVSRTASLTFAKTGFPKCVSPAFFGFVPPTTFVPGNCQCAIYLGEGSFSQYHIQLLAARENYTQISTNCIENQASENPHLPCLPVKP